MITSEQERKIAERLDILIPKHLVGYQYLKMAIIMAMDCEKINLKHEIYPKVAKKYGIKKVSVEEGMKTALRKAFCKNRTNFKVFFGEAKYFGCSTPAKFIKAFINKIKAE